MVEAPRRVQQTRRDVIGFQVRIVREALRWRLAGRQQLQDVVDAHPHAPYAGASPALLRTDGDALEELGWRHGLRLRVGTRGKIGRWDPAAEPLLSATIGRRIGAPRRILAHCHTHLRTGIAGEDDATREPNRVLPRGTDWVRDSDR